MSEEIRETQENPQVDAPETSQKSDGTQNTESKKIELTQEELDEIIAKRLARERKKLEKYADYDEIKAELEKYRAEAEERRKAELTEVERLKEELESLRKEKEELESKYSSLTESVKQSKIEARFTELAREHGIEHLQAAKKLADFSGVSIEDDEVLGMEDVVKKLVEENPFLVAKKEPESVGGQSNPPREPVVKTKQQILKEAQERARSGNPADLARYLMLKKG